MTLKDSCGKYMQTNHLQNRINRLINSGRWGQRPLYIYITFLLEKHMRHCYNNMLVIINTRGTCVCFRKQDYADFV